MHFCFIRSNFLRSKILFTVLDVSTFHPLIHTSQSRSFCTVPPNSLNTNFLPSFHHSHATTYPVLHSLSLSLSPSSSTSKRCPQPPTHSGQWVSPSPAFNWPPVNKYPNYTSHSWPLFRLPSWLQMILRERSDHALTTLCCTVVFLLALFPIKPRPVS